MYVSVRVRVAMLTDRRVAIRRTAKYGDAAPESADLLFMYGKALLENAIAQSGVVGKEEAEGALKGEAQGELARDKARSPATCCTLRLLLICC